MQTIFFWNYRALCANILKEGESDGETTATERNGIVTRGSCSDVVKSWQNNWKHGIAVERHVIFSFAAMFRRVNK